MESGNAAGVITVGALWGPFDEDHLAPSRPRFVASFPQDVVELVKKQY
jgi:phosphoglycolate phosphatase-like HAD superfamily hydrolase